MGSPAYDAKQWPKVPGAPDGDTTYPQFAVEYIWFGDIGGSCVGQYIHCECVVLQAGCQLPLWQCVVDGDVVEPREGTACQDVPVS